MPVNRGKHPSADADEIREPNQLPLIQNDPVSQSTIL